MNKPPLVPEKDYPCPGCGKKGERFAIGESDVADHIICSNPSCWVGTMGIHEWNTFGRARELQAATLILGKQKGILIQLPLRELNFYLEIEYDETATGFWRVDRMIGGLSKELLQAFPTLDFALVFAARYIIEENKNGQAPTEV